MCINTIAACPYPHHDPVASIIFDPAKKDSWQICDRTHPWGRLSCGALEVHHSVNHSPRTNSHNAWLDHTSNLVPTPVSAPSSPETLHHNLADTSYLETPICQWCTAVLNIHAHKFKSVQEEAKKRAEKLEQAMQTEEKLKALDKKIVELESVLEGLRFDAWIQRKKAMGKIDS